MIRYLADIFSRANLWSFLCLLVLALLVGWLTWDFRSVPEVQKLVAGVASLVLAFVVAQRDRLVAEKGGGG